jgi:hypothetical protein
LATKVVEATTVLSKGLPVGSAADPLRETMAPKKVPEVINMWPPMAVTWTGLAT